MEELQKEFLKELLGYFWKNPVIILEVTPGRISGGALVEFLVELPSEFLKQLAGELLNELLWNFWTPVEFWMGFPKELRKSTWLNFKGIS